MYKTWYDVVLPTFGAENVELLFTDTDSLCFQILECPKADLALERLQPIMDYSNLDKDHELYDEGRKNVLGFFKSEIKGTPIAFAGVKAKRWVLKRVCLYSY